MTELLPGQITWEQWGEIFSDVGLWAPAVGHVWESSPVLSQTTDLAGPLILESGFPGTCAVFVVNKAAVVKFFPPFARQEYVHERTILERFASHPPVLPRLLAAGVLHDRTSWPYLVTRYESGAAWRDKCSCLTRANQLAIAAELGHAVRDVHRWPLSEGEEWPAAKAWSTLIQARVAAAVGELAELTQLPSGVVHEAAALLARTDWDGTPPCLVNADLTEDHILIERAEDGWHLTCVIDWADAEVAAPFYEWVAIWFGFCHRDAGLLRAFLRAYDADIKVDAEFVSRLLTFTLVHRFGPRMIADIIPDERQAALGSLAQLTAELFPGLA